MTNCHSGTRFFATPSVLGHRTGPPLALGLRDQEYGTVPEDQGLRMTRSRWSTMFGLGVCRFDGPEGSKTAIFAENFNLAKPNLT
jgi:hypothetical protein